MHQFPHSRVDLRLPALAAGWDFSEEVIPPDDPAMKAEMLLLSSSMLVPSLPLG